MAAENKIQYIDGRAHKVPNFVPIIGGRIFYSEPPSIIVHFHFEPNARLIFGTEAKYHGQTYASPRIIRQQATHNENPPTASMDVQYWLARR